MKVTSTTLPLLALNLNSLTGLIGEGEARCSDVGFAPADLAFLRRDWDMRANLGRQKVQRKQYCAQATYFSILKS